MTYRIALLAYFHLYQKQMICCIAPGSSILACLGILYVYDLSLNIETHNFITVSSENSVNSCFLSTVLFYYRIGNLFS
jgi:hypothetical protein